MFTDTQRAIFTNLLDANWEMKHGNPDKAVEVDELTSQLKESMGAEAFNTFMANGRAMFAPKQ